MLRPIPLGVLITSSSLLISVYTFSSWSFSNSVPHKLRSIEVSDKPLLQLNDRGEFHISIFSDLHYGEEEHGWGIDQDIDSTRVMNSVLNHESPDLVVINGDLITGENTFRDNSTKYLDMIVEPMLERGIPWACTYGNHDSQFNLSREELFLEESKYSSSYTKHSPPGVSGVTNYYLLLFPPETGASQKPVAILWFFDSEGGMPFQDSKDPKAIPDWVSPVTVEWFKSAQQALQKRWGLLPSLAFVHIPPSAFLSVQQQLLPHAGDKSKYFPGINDDVPLAAQGDGWQDLPFMQALVDTPMMHSIHSGHDHGDTWCANWPQGENSPQGVSQPHVCFSKHSGYGGYGNWNRGGTNLRLTFTDSENTMEVDSWIRIEDGSVVQRIKLNATYGIDTYPADDGEK